MEIVDRGVVERNSVLDLTGLEAARAFAASRERPALIYFLPDEEPIGTPNVREVRDHIGDREFEELDLVIHSLGGDIHAAYQLISLLRLRAKKVNACVPWHARSAATLLCVGAHLIVLDELAALGPLDAQVYKGEGEAGNEDYESALTPFKALERIRDFSLETMQAVAAVLWDAGIQRNDEVLGYAMEFVKATTAPLFEKIDSEKLGDYSQALAIGDEYGSRLLGVAELEDDADRQRIKRLLKRLVHEYPSHEYAIDYHELRRIGLNVELFTREEGSAAGELALHAGTRIIELINPGDRVDEAERDVVSSRTQPADSNGDTTHSVESAAMRQHSSFPGGQPLQPRNPWRPAPFNLAPGTDRSDDAGG